MTAKDFTTDELQVLYDLLIFESEGRVEHDLEPDSRLDSAFEKIAKELIARGIS